MILLPHKYNPLNHSPLVSPPYVSNNYYFEVWSPSLKPQHFHFNVWSNFNAAKMFAIARSYVNLFVFLIRILSINDSVIGAHLCLIFCFSLIWTAYTYALRLGVCSWVTSRFYWLEMGVGSGTGHDTIRNWVWYFT